MSVVGDGLVFLDLGEVEGRVRANAFVAASAGISPAAARASQTAISTSSQALELRLLAPNGGHLRPRVARDHGAAQGGCRCGGGHCVHHTEGLRRQRRSRRSCLSGTPRPLRRARPPGSSSAKRKNDIVDHQCVGPTGREGRVTDRGGIHRAQASASVCNEASSRWAIRMLVPVIRMVRIDRSSYEALKAGCAAGGRGAGATLWATPYLRAIVVALGRPEGASDAGRAGSLRYGLPLGGDRVLLGAARRAELPAPALLDLGPGHDRLRRAARRDLPTAASSMTRGWPTRAGRRSRSSWRSPCHCCWRRPSSRSWARARPGSG